MRFALAAVFAVASLLLPVAAAADEVYLSEFTAIIPDWHPESEMNLELEGGRDMVIYEVTRFPDAIEPTTKQLQAAGEFWERARAAIKMRGWDDFDQAIADDFELMYGDVNHYASREHIGDGRVLDPERPEFLIYYDTGESKRLAGLMFLAAPGERGPQLAGPMSVWHFHIWERELCLWKELLVEGLAGDGGCVDGIASERSPEMLHLWFFDHPQGMFATGMDLEPFQIKRLEEVEF